jgi:Flp pilus assembly protein TadG
MNLQRGHSSGNGAGLRRIGRALRDERRRGSVLVLSAALLIVIFGLTAFALDIGFIALTKTQMQTASDASSLGACNELEEGLGAQPTLTMEQTLSTSRAAAQAVANANPNGGLDSTYVNTTRDVRFGQAVWDPTTKQWAKSWGVSPYNMVQVTVHRDTVTEGQALGDKPLDTFFAGSLGVKTVDLQTDATAALLPGVGVSIESASGLTAGVLPITLDVPTWEALMNGVGTDNYGYDPVTKHITGNSDGVKEVNLFPYGLSTLPPGNRGTVDLGDPNNSTSALTRQILYGLNEEDLSYFGGELRTDLGPLSINGDTGISAALKDPLEAIKGQPRLIPLFSNVLNPGDNAVYTVVRFVPIRIVNVRLTGGNKQVIVQPCTYVGAEVIRGGTSVTNETYFTSPRLIQ